HSASIDLTSEAASEESGCQCVEIDPARGSSVEGLQTLGRSQQQARRFAPTVAGKRDASTYNIRPRSLHLVERAYLRLRDELERVIESARLLLRLGCGERPRRAPRKVEGQGGRALQKG